MISIRNISDSISNPYLQSFLSWRHWQRKGGLLWYAILLGFVGGGVAALFKWSLHACQDYLLNDFAGLTRLFENTAPWPMELFFLIPAVGGLLAGVLVYYFAPDAAGAGTDALIDAYHNKGGYISLKTSVVKFFASVLTLGSGGSAGQEGPMAQIGGGLGSFVARKFRLSDSSRRILMLTGTAAGLGAIFHAPLGGALTAAEIVYKEDFESKGFLPFTIASVVAFAFYSVLTGQHSAYLAFPQLPFHNYSELFLYALLGLLCVPFSLLFVKLFFYVKDRFAKLQIHPILKPALGGLLIGLIAYGAPQAIGADWSALQDAVAGHFSFHTLLLIAGFKILATALTIGSGGSGGVFGPSLFIGGMIGGAFGYGIPLLGLDWISNPSSYVLVGMGAFFAGAAKAPLAGLIMVCEITGNYGLLAPLLIATTVHLTLSRKWSLYVHQKENKFASPIYQSSLRADVLKTLHVAEMHTTSNSFSMLHVEDPIFSQWKECRDLEQEIFPVVDKDGNYLGIVTASSLHAAYAEGPLTEILLWEDLLEKVEAIPYHTNLQNALDLFRNTGCSQLPVIKEDKVISLLSWIDVLDRYQQELKGSMK